ncbi:hypothetical protein FHY06_002675 [Variovorax sp. BK613]|nr:hypothetical protein [Variovorax sp. BK613]
MVGGAVRCPAEVDSTQLKQVFRDRASQCAAAAAARYRKALKAPIPPGVRGWSSARLRAPSNHDQIKALRDELCERS